MSEAFFADLAGRMSLDPGNVVSIRLTPHEALAVVRQPSGRMVVRTYAYVGGAVEFRSEGAPFGRAGSPSDALSGQGGRPVSARRGAT
jgi:hypothetical protein